MPANERAPRGAPEGASVTFVVDAADSGAPTSFPLQLEVTGKANTIARRASDEDPDQFIFTSPSMKVTLTNLETDPSFTTNISGSTHREDLPDGGYIDTCVGRHLLGDPEIDDGEPGLVVVAGRFTATYDAEGNVVAPLSGDGHITDVFELLL